MGADEADVNGELGTTGDCVEPADGKPATEFPFGFSCDELEGRVGVAGNPPTTEDCGAARGAFKRKVSQSDARTNTTNRKIAVITGNIGLAEPIS